MDADRHLRGAGAVAVLFATVVFAVGNFAPLSVMQRLALGPRSALLVHFIISIYGGYFGGGIGFLMLAALTMVGMRDINTMNGLKLVLVGVMTATAIVAFVLADVVRWVKNLPMVVGSVAGGYAGAHGARRIDQRLIKVIIVVLGAGLTILFFWHGA